MRAIDRGRGHRGFTLFELVVVVALISALAGVFLQRASASMETAERMAMQTQARAIEAALQLRVAQLIVRGHEREASRLADTNPIDWMLARPPNYLGELRAAPNDPNAQGHWYFDPATRELVYLIRRGDRFTADGKGRKQVRYRAVLVREGDAGADAGRNVVGAVFRPVEAYRWL